MKRSSTRSLYAVQLCFLAAMASAAPVTVKLPAETATLKSATLPGYDLAQQKCSTCHSADYINFQPPGMSLAQWTAEAGKMQHTYGAPITDEDVKLIGAYLAVTYGSAKAIDPEVQAASIAMPAQASSDVTTLLQNNACLSCHAIDHKVVGPAYRDVAAQYARDPQALTKLMASIEHGSAGKWGEVPMPAFAQLSADELQKLAAFVLQQ